MNLFVSYSHRTGFGNSIIESLHREPICAEDIIETQDRIMGSGDGALKEVVIINWKVMLDK